MVCLLTVHPWSCLTWPSAACKVSLGLEAIQKATSITRLDWASDNSREAAQYSQWCPHAISVGALSMVYHGMESQTWFILLIIQIQHNPIIVYSCSPSSLDIVIIKFHVTRTTQLWDLFDNDITSWSTEEVRPLIKKDLSMVNKADSVYYSVSSWPLLNSTVLVLDCQIAVVDSAIVAMS